MALFFQLASFAERRVRRVRIRLEGVFVTGLTGVAANIVIGGWLCRHFLPND